MNTYDKCKNCCGEYGLHHFETNQCPVGGREAPIGRKQEWKTTTFEKEDDSATVIAALTEFIKEVFDEMDGENSWIIANPERYASHRHFARILLKAKSILSNTQEDLILRERNRDILKMWAQFNYVE